MRDIDVDDDAEMFESEIRSLGDAGGLVLKAPLPVVTYRFSDGSFYASQEELNIHTAGDTKVAALSEMVDEIISLYRDLQRDSSNLGSDLRRIWGRLQELIYVDQ